MSGFSPPAAGGGGGGSLATITPGTSADLAAAVSDETGTGSAVFATSPTLVTPVLGVATATSVNGAKITAAYNLFIQTNFGGL